MPGKSKKKSDTKPKYARKHSSLCSYDTHMCLILTWSTNI
jgi:hypothetical protein